ncbi:MULTISPECIES: siderophore ferric iron reductase [Shewanella]|uniref:siderophore ferric iron reductase n=1 Tax=Shewanella TaxID=22 RepID=UPI00048D7DC0|nr:MULTISPECIES: siderophore ferric iron reductase [Shewanella]QLE83945.1 siderophore ferric iron reductase [Shewanella sp. Scap07]
MTQQVIQQIYQHCEQLSPYLKAMATAELQANDSHISVNGSNVTTIKSLHHHLQQQAPEAGRSYWLTRSWDLLTWQPLYLAVTAIYQCQALPNLQHMQQRHCDGVVAGFSFSCTACASGSVKQLIQQAGQQLRAMFDHYRVELDQSVRCRPKFTDTLLADTLISRLLLLQQTHPEMPTASLRQHIGWWLEAMSLPLRALDTVHSNCEGKLVLQRSSCCAVYKTQTGSKCANCPRLK